MSQDPSIASFLANLEGFVAVSDDEVSHKEPKLTVSGVISLTLSVPMGLQNRKESP